MVLAIIQFAWCVFSRLLVFSSCTAESIAQYDQSCMLIQAAALARYELRAGRYPGWHPIGRQLATSLLSVQALRAPKGIYRMYTNYIKHV